MKKRALSFALALTLILGLMSGCGAKGTDHLEAGKKFLYGTDGTEINLEKAHGEFTQALEEGCEEANFYLGVLCDWHSYPEKDFYKAKEYYEAVPDDLNAKVSLGILHIGGFLDQVDTEKASGLFQEAIDSGYVDGYLGMAAIAQFSGDYGTAEEYLQKVISEGTEQVYVASAKSTLGASYLYGMGVAQDYTKAAELLNAAKDAGDAPAITVLGIMYREGMGFPQDYEKAMAYFEEAEKFGDPNAFVSLGWMYADGQGVQQDYNKARTYFEAAGQYGLHDAKFALGYLYEKGYGVAQDYEKAREYYEEAIIFNNSSAENALGWMYYKGKGVKQDYAAAKEYFEAAAALNMPEAMVGLADMYYHGNGVEKDYSSVETYLKDIAEDGNISALRMLSLVYREGGYGVLQDSEKAEEYEKRADALEAQRSGSAD